MKKRICSIFILLAVCFLMCSCKNTSEDTNKVKDEIENMSMEIVRCLRDGDKEGFKDLFCERVRNIENYDAQVDRLFEYFECKEYISSSFDVTKGSEKIMKNDEVVEWHTTETISHIKTLARNPVRDHNVPIDEDVVEKDYHIEYYYQIVYADDVSLLGLHSVTISLPGEDDEGITVGTDRLYPENLTNDENTVENNE